MGHTTSTCIRGDKPDITTTAGSNLSAYYYFEGASVSDNRTYTLYVDYESDKEIKDEVFVYYGIVPFTTYPVEPGNFTRQQLHQGVFVNFTEGDVLGYQMVFESNNVQELDVFEINVKRFEFCEIWDPTICYGGYYCPPVTNQSPVQHCNHYKATEYITNIRKMGKRGFQIEQDPFTRFAPLSL
eukprot:NODE_467_length_7071_cov_0.830752.p4 type:complete len:184 gc:universal NODE_467_length_7071_cov_0.830752:4824-5375(+)